MRKGILVDDSVKNDLIERFRAYLDSRGADAADAVTDDGETSDLYSLFVELAGLRTEVRTESRLVKDALDQFRAVFDRLEKDHASLEREVERARSETRDQARTLLRPLLLDLLDLRDRLEAGAKEPKNQMRWRLIGFGRRADPELEAWREGQAMTLRRLDRLLEDRQVVPLVLAGRPFDPRVGGDDFQDGVFPRRRAATGADRHGLPAGPGPRAALSQRVFRPDSPAVE